MELKLEQRSYYYSVCMVCWGTENVKYCVKCKIASYCCKEHQQLDWPYHKEFCKILRNKDKAAWKQMEAMQALDRNLYVFEIQMMFNERYCLTCHTKEDLILCTECKCASFCRKHYGWELTKHKSDCLEYQKAFKIDKFFWELAPIILEFHLSPISENALLEDAYKFTRCKPSLPPALDRVIKEHALSAAQSMIYVLEKIGLIKNRCFIKDIITIHIIKPINVYDETIKYYTIPKFLMNWIKNLKHVKCVVMNCDLSCVRGSDVSFKRYNENIDYSSVDLLWIFNTALQLPTPDMSKYLRNTLQSGLPICLCSNIRENMIKDIKYLERLGAKPKNYFMKNQNNPFASKRPYRNLDHRLTDRNPTIVYQDSFISVIKPN